MTFGKVANKMSTAVGSPWAALAAFMVVIVWAISGPAFKFSSGWQLVINTGTTIVTFLMVFIIQNTQNRETKALQVKLDGLIAAIDGASNDLIDAEKLDDRSLERLETRYHQLTTELARRNLENTRS
jgi:low affinity Fe/Cu permease